jgi:hypothetical protein
MYTRVYSAVLGKCNMIANDKSEKWNQMLKHEELVLEILQRGKSADIQLA